MVDDKKEVEEWEDPRDQRNNVFFAGCLVHKEKALLMIDGGCNTNTITEDLVAKLMLPTKLVEPQVVGWINDSYNITVDRQVHVTFSIGDYVDDVICFVVPTDINATIGLGRPWQYDRRVIHDGFTNRYHFTFNGVPFTLLPMSPQQKLQALRGENSERELRFNNDYPTALMMISSDTTTNPPTADDDDDNNDKMEKEDVENQRNNLFLTRCFVKDVVATLTIDGGSYINTISADFVEKLGLPTKNLLRPIQMRWFNEEVKMDKKAKVKFSFGSYVDEVICIVTPMQFADILLGRPWQYDRHTYHDGFTNKYHFKFNGLTFSLEPMSWQEAQMESYVMEEKRYREEELKRMRSSESESLESSCC